MAYLNDIVFDSGLSYAGTNGIRVDICFTQEPTTYTEATDTLSCGNDTVDTGAPEAGATEGRRVVIPAITAGAVTDTQTAGWWALTDNSSVLIAAGPLTATQAVTLGNTFTLDEISITLNDVVAV